jgi:hypothetical protein
MPQTTPGPAEQYQSGNLDDVTVVSVYFSHCRFLRRASLFGREASAPRMAGVAGEAIR